MAEIYHIGTQDEITIGELIHYAGELMDFSGAYENAPTYPGFGFPPLPGYYKSKNAIRI